jgi:hypothetical protein
LNLALYPSTSAELPAALGGSVVARAVHTMIVSEYQGIVLSKNMYHKRAQVERRQLLLQVTLFVRQWMALSPLAKRRRISLWECCLAPKPTILQIPYFGAGILYS